VTNSAVMGLKLFSTKLGKVMEKRAPLGLPGSLCGMKAGCVGGLGCPGRRGAAVIFIK